MRVQVSQVSMTVFLTLCLSTWDVQQPLQRVEWCLCKGLSWHALHVGAGIELSRMCRLSASPAEQLLDNDGSSDAVSSPAISIFVMRDNPRQFFVRQPLPSTASAQSASPAPRKQPEEAPSEGGTKEGSHPQPEGQCSPLYGVSSVYSDHMHRICQ